MNIPTVFSSELFMTKRTFERVRDAFVDDSHVARQFVFVLVNLATLRAGIFIYFALTLDAFMLELLVSFQTVKAGKVSPTGFTGDDNTAVVNLHVCLILESLDKVFTTDLTGVSVLGLALMYNSDVSLEELFVSEHLPTVTALE